MRIITWNCNMAFRKKAAAVMACKPDILIVPECENLAKLSFPFGTLRPMDALWFGTNPSKGIGIFSYNYFRLKTLDCHNEQLKHVIPIAVVGGSFNFNLFAIWTNNPGDSDGRYVEQVGKAIHHYEDLLQSTKTILTGDFNSNSIWDKEHRVYSHSTIVRLLEKKGISSTYHLHYCQIQGMEEHPTIYMYRRKDKAYHIDYCFASEDFIKILQSVQIGGYDEWVQHSDHVPIIVDFDM